jgi:thioester reductase-like protein/acyl-coenzyme A synthetase/AMP-(fatty) acid ligase
MEDLSRRNSSEAAGGLSIDATVHAVAERSPERTWISIPNSTDRSTGYNHITYQQLSRAIDGFARFVESTIGTSKDAAVAAYMGVNDERHFVAVLGLIQAGYKALLPSPRNSGEHQAVLFNATGCRHLFHDHGMEQQVEVLKTGKPEVSTHAIPSFVDLVREGERLGRYDSRCSVNPDDHVIVLHTSGSTGAPKPIFLTNGFLSTFYPANQLPPPQGRQSAFGLFAKPHDRFFSMLPAYHMFGLIVMVRTICATDNIVVTSPERPPNASSVIEVLQDLRPKAGAFAPSLLEDLCDTEAGLEAAGSLEHVFFGGGPLRQKAGDKLCQITHLQTLLGSTEAGFLHSLVLENPKDWKYFEWVPESGIVMDPVEDGVCELVIKNQGDRRIKGIFHTFPDLEEWRTKDLFAPHPQKDGLWTYQGRRDDLIVLSNGEKFNPVGFEKAVESHPLVRGAVVAGEARFQLAILLELDWESLPDDVESTSLIEDLWPTIEEINKQNPSHGRVWKNMILLAAREKPFVRAAKGSIIRKRTTNEYAAEIDALYGAQSVDKLDKISRDADLPTTKEHLRRVFKSTNLSFPASAADDADFFTFGVDSLQVVALSRALGNAFTERVEVSPQAIYQNPTVNALAQHLSGDNSNATSAALTNSRQEIMAALIDKYTRDMPSVPRHESSSSSSSSEKHTVILTGSTGSLGNYILQDLITSTDVAKVYCLNRSADAESRNRASFEERGASPNFTKVTFLQTDLSEDQFSLPSEIYAKLLGATDIFIHNAWAVDFNKTVASFEPHIAGTRRAINFSIHSRRRAQIVFVSSIAAVANWPATQPDSSTQGAVPESIISDHSAPLPQGYGESKHVAECMLALASERANVPATIVRCGQLAGPSDAGSIWNRHEWIPSLVITSREMGMLPRTLGQQDIVDWVPMDVAALTVCESAFARSTSSQVNTCTGGAGLARAFHVINPRTSRWSNLAPSLAQTLQEQTGKRVEIVSFGAWVEALRQCPMTAQEMEKKPAIKLLDFYEGLQAEHGSLPRLATGETEGVSRALGNVEAISAELVQAWIRTW